MSLQTDAPRLVLGRYRLTDHLATGATAEVWRARDEQLNRWVAVKLLHPHLLPDARSRERLASEARAAGALRHPAIATIYDVDVAGEAPALVMQLVEGETLATRLRRGPPRAREAAAIAADLATALLHAHTRGIVHRDVKPGNILLDASDHAHLVDFGIAHSLAASAQRLTMTGTVMGTLRYMAPEQLADGPIGPKTDLYALGVVLFEMLAGRPPFAASSPVALAEAQRSGPPPLPGVDPALAALARSCLAFEPADRPRHAGAVADALRDWLHGRPAALPAAVDTAAVTQPVPVVAAAPPRPVRRRAPWLVAVAGGLLLGALGAAALNAGFGPFDPFDRAPAAVPAAAPSSSATASPSASASAPAAPAPQSKDDHRGKDDKAGNGGGKGKGHGG